MLGAQETSHFPLRLVRRTVVCALQGPTSGSVKCSVTLALAVAPDFAVVTKPERNDALETPSAVNVWAFSELKSAGGSATRARIVAQSPRSQAAR